jgi:endonuclease-3
MASVNRAALITKLHRVLKKNYKPAAPAAKETVLDNMLFAACLENASPEQAEAAFTALHERFFDLNEVRVSTVRELAEALHMLPDAEAAALRVKQVLQSIFEALYSFDLEAIKKQNIGQAVKQLEGYAGSTPFSIAYVTQTALGGHAIAVNAGAMQALVVVGVVTESEAEKQRVPGMERAIPKTKGPEFFALLHQLGVTMGSTPHSPALRKLLLEIDPECKDRLPKRAGKKEDEASENGQAPAAKAGGGSKSSKRAPTKRAPAKSAAAKKKAPAKKKPAAKKTTGKKAPAPKASAKKKTAAKSGKPSGSKKTSAKRLAKKKPK